MLGSHSSLADLINSLVHKTQGNPFFLEECVRALEESGALAGEPGKYRLGSARTEMRIPATVHGVLAARIDGLPPTDRSILLCASVIGQSVDFRLLRDLTDTKLEGRR